MRTAKHAFNFACFHPDRRLPIVGATLGICFTLLAFANISNAGEVRSGISSPETYVGVPVTLQIQFSNVSEHEPPEMPEVDGLEIEPAGTPSRSSRISIINGRRSEELSITYAFEITPQREGEFIIPAITVDYDDRRELVRGFRLVAKKSENGDLIDVLIEGSVASVYVGEALELQLNILIRPYEDEPTGITLSEGQMWQLISDRTDWGIFSDRMEEIAQNNQRPVGREVTRDDADGKPQQYYLYSIDATIYPQRPGEIDADGCRIVMHYPTSLGRRRSPLEEMFGDDAFPRSRFFDDAFSGFGSRLTVTSARPLVAEASIEPIEVNPIPNDGRPDDYRGAVGRYRIIAQATPDTAKVGDPITLHLVVAGDGPMDLVQAPPLAQIPELTANFKVAREPLAGLVEGETKLFSTTIRPRSTDVSEIPPIPFSFFDPQQEQFVTVTTDPIPITVEAAERMSLDTIVASDRPDRSESSPPASDERSTASAVVDELYPVGSLLESQSAALPVHPLHLWFITLPPLVILLLFLVSRRDRLTGWYAGLSPADQQFRKRLRRADSPDDIREAMLRWLARRTRMKPSNESSAIGALRLAGHRELAVVCEQIFDRCRRAENGVTMDETLKTERIKADAERLIQKWKQCNHGRSRSQRSARTSERRRAISAGMILLAMAGANTASLVQAAERDNDTERLTLEQRRLLLGEAVELHRQALASRVENPAESREQAERAAQKYQTVADTGEVSAALFFNKAGAEYHAGQKGRAVADYRRALKLNPDDDRALDGLRHVERSLGVVDDDIEFAPLAPAAVSASAVWLTRWIPPAYLGYLAITAWILLWLVVGLRIRRRDFPWKTITGFALLIAVVAGTGYFMHRYHWTRDNVAIVVEPELTLRSGDGESFAPVSGHSDTEGIEVEVMKERNGWAKIKVDGTTSGWVPASSIAVI